MEAELPAIRIDVAMIRQTCAIKGDLAEVKADLKAAISEVQTKIIIWVMSAILIAQLLPVLKDVLRPDAGTQAPAARSK